MEERRKFSRIDISTNVKINLEKIEDMKEFLTKDLSAGGVFIKTSNPLPKGRQVVLEFSVLEGNINVLEAEGKVIRCVTSEQCRAGMVPGMAVQFTSIDPESKAIIENLVKECFAGMSTGSSRHTPEK